MSKTFNSIAEVGIIILLIIVVGSLCYDVFSRPGRSDDPSDLVFYFVTNEISDINSLEDINQQQPCFIYWHDDIYNRFNWRALGLKEYWLLPKNQNPHMDMVRSYAFKEFSSAINVIRGGDSEGIDIILATAVHTTREASFLNDLQLEYKKGGIKYFKIEIN